MAVKKSCFVGVRLTEEQVEKLLALSKLTTKPGNVSEGLRLAVDRAHVPAASSEQPAQSDGVKRYV